MANDAQQISNLIDAVKGLNDQYRRSNAEMIAYSATFAQLIKRGVDLEHAEASLESSLRKGEKASKELSAAYILGVRCQEDFRKSSERTKIEMEGAADAAKGYATVLDKVSTAIVGSIVALQNQATAALGISVSYKDLRATQIAYNRTLIESYTTAKNYGQSLAGMEAGQRLASKSTNLNRQQFAELDKTFKQMAVGIPRTSVEVVKFAADIQKHFGASAEKTQELTRSFLSLEQEIPNLTDMWDEVKKSYRGSTTEGDKAAARMAVSLRALGVSKENIQNSLTMVRGPDKGVEKMTQFEKISGEAEQATKNLQLSIATRLTPEMEMMSKATKFAAEEAEKLPDVFFHIMAAANALEPVLSRLTAVMSALGNASLYLKGARAVMPGMSLANSEARAAKTALAAEARAIKTASGGAAALGAGEAAAAGGGVAGASALASSVRTGPAPLGSVIPKGLAGGTSAAEVAESAAAPVAKVGLLTGSGGRFVSGLKGGAIAGVIGGGIAGYEEFSQREKEPMGRRIGAAALSAGAVGVGATVGGGIGGVVGGGIGALFGGAGAVPGAWIGNVVGSMVGGWAGGKAIPWLQKMLGLEKQATTEVKEQVKPKDDFVEKVKESHNLNKVLIEDLTSMTDSLDKQVKIAKQLSDSYGKMAQFAEITSKWASMGLMPKGAGKDFQIGLQALERQYKVVQTGLARENIIAQVGMGGGTSGELMQQLKDAGRSKDVQAFELSKSVIDKKSARREELKPVVESGAGTAAQKKELEDISSEIESLQRTTYDAIARAIENIGAPIADTQKTLSRISDEIEKYEIINRSGASTDEQRLSARVKLQELAAISGKLGEEINKTEAIHQQLIERRIQSTKVETESNLQNNEASIQMALKRKTLAESNMLGLAKSYQYTRDAVVLMEQQTKILQQRASAQDRDIKQQMDIRGIHVDTNTILTDQVAAAEEIARQMSGQGEDKIKQAQQSILGLAKARLETEGKILDNANEQAQLTKQIREGYMDAMAEAVSGAGEYAALIGSTRTGATQLINAGAPDTFRYGGVGRRGASTAAIRHTTMGGALSGPMVSTGLERYTGVNEGFNMMGPLGRREMDNPIGLGGTGNENFAYGLDAAAGKAAELGEATDRSASSVQRFGTALDNIVRGNYRGTPGGATQQNVLGNPGIPTISTTAMGTALGMSVMDTTGSQAMVSGRAGGGHISGPGGSREDRIPAMLSNGEYVINAKSARAIGRNSLDGLNRYAEGGLAHADGTLMSDYPATNSTGASSELRRRTQELRKSYGPKMFSELISTRENAERYGITPDMLLSDTSHPLPSWIMETEKHSKARNMAVLSDLEELPNSSRPGAKARIVEGFGRYLQAHINAAGKALDFLGDILPQPSPLKFNKPGYAQPNGVGGFGALEGFDEEKSPFKLSLPGYGSGFGTLSQANRVLQHQENLRNRTGIYLQGGAEWRRPKASSDTMTTYYGKRMTIGEKGNFDDSQRAAMDNLQKEFKTPGSTPDMSPNALNPFRDGSPSMSKKIRNDEGYWQQIEAYIEGHSPAQRLGAIYAASPVGQIRMQAAYEKMQASARYDRMYGPANKPSFESTGFPEIFGQKPETAAALYNPSDILNSIMIPDQKSSGGEVKHTVTIDLSNRASGLFGTSHATDYDSSGSN